MTTFDLSNHPHRRYNPLTGEWILVSPRRASRPWQGKVEASAGIALPAHDPDCYLCPGNKRAGTAVNPRYTSTFVFDNDFSALHQAKVDESLIASDGLLLARPESGICRVVCFSPRHDLTLAEMTAKEIRAVVDVWKNEFVDLGSRPFIKYIQIFENKGEIMGCSNPHPHGQIWAESSIPVEPMKETEHMRGHFDRRGRSLLAEYVETERNARERIVLENGSFVVLVPFWAVWPFETMVVCKQHIQTIAEMDEIQLNDLSDAVRRITARYDNLFETSFPYSAGIHQAPTDGTDHPEWDFHLHFYPPLLRSASIRKFMVGYEMLANPQRDVTAEWSAAQLREQSEKHFRGRAAVSN
ncbi:MAG: UDP-glucose--hexose-1-phosphate uridylyltransferase [Bacteroidota bacterium]